MPTDEMHIFVNQMTGTEQTLRMCAYTRWTLLLTITCTWQPDNAFDTESLAMSHLKWHLNIYACVDFKNCNFFSQYSNSVSLIFVYVASLSSSTLYICICAKEGIDATMFLWIKRMTKFHMCLPMSRKSRWRQHWSPGVAEMHFISFGIPGSGLHM